MYPESGSGYTKKYYMLGIKKEVEIELKMFENENVMFMYFLFFLFIISNFFGHKPTY